MWLTLTRMRDPKLRYFEKWLDKLNIPHRRNLEVDDKWLDKLSIPHRRNLEVDDADYEKAPRLMNTTIDMGDGIYQLFKDIPDDDPMFVTAACLFYAEFCELYVGDSVENVQNLLMTRLIEIGRATPMSYTDYINSNGPIEYEVVIKYPY